MRARVSFCERVSSPRLEAVVLTQSWKVTTMATETIAQYNSAESRSRVHVIKINTQQADNQTPAAANAFIRARTREKVVPRELKQRPRGTCTLVRSRRDLSRYWLHAKAHAHTSAALLFARNASDRLFAAAATAHVQIRHAQIHMRGRANCGFKHTTKKGYICKRLLLRLWRFTRSSPAPRRPHK